MPQKRKLNKLPFEIIIQSINSSSTNIEDLNATISGSYPDNIISLKNQITNVTPYIIQTKENILSITKKARDFITNNQNENQKIQANKLLEEIENILRGYDELGFPEFRISSAEDGSLSLSWKVVNAYFGAAIRPNTNESSWFLIQGDSEKGFKADGYLDDLDYETQLPSLFNLLIQTQIKEGGRNDIAPG